MFFFFDLFLVKKKRKNNSDSDSYLENEAYSNLSFKEKK
jgi:hypothetical protein